MPHNLRSAIVAALAILGSIVGLFIASLQLANTNERIEHAIEVKLAIAQLRVDLLLMNKGGEDYAMTGDPQRLDIFRKAKGSLRANIDRVRFLTLDNPVQKAPIDGIDARVTEQMAKLQSIVDIRDREGRDAAIRAFEADLNTRASRTGLHCSR